MATLYFLRAGSGQHAIASASTIDLPDAISRFANASFIVSPAMPRIADGLAKWFSEPVAVVLHVDNSDDPTPPFRNPGFYLLKDVAPNTEATRNV